MAGTDAEEWADLHVHSAHSLLDGACWPDALVGRAAELGYPALALTDHDSLGGIVVHALACTAHGLAAIAGVELTLDDGSHLTLLARDGLGYASLCRLVSTAQLAGEKGAPRATLADVAACALGLECLTGCRRGRVPAALLSGDEGAARHHLGELRAIFGAGHVWVEVQRAGLADDHALLYGLAHLAHREHLPLVATGNAHYAQASDRDLQDVLVCIRERVPLTRAGPHLRPGASWHLRAGAEMARLFADLPGALRGARELASRCRFTLSDIPAAFPAFPVPPGETSDTYLRGLVVAGAEERYGPAGSWSGPVRERMEHELAVIAQLQMADYLLAVWGIVCCARAQGILCQGRGSAVGSLVCYCLGITAVEPFAHHLSFERFLAVGRSDPPDIDLDLPADRAALPHAGPAAPVIR
jgi:error-prone DNA polymerase